VWWVKFMSGPAPRLASNLSAPGLPGQALRERFPADLLAVWLKDSREYTLRLVEDLDDDQFAGPSEPVGGPLLWELGHLAWFAERWVLRRQGLESLLGDAEGLYDPVAVPPAARWQTALPGRAATMAFLKGVLERCLARLEQPTGMEDVYFYLLAIFHEDRQGELLACRRQALGQPAPRLVSVQAKGYVAGRGALPGDAFVPGGRFLLGALPSEPFVFDTEKWAHPVDLRPMRIARAPVTQGEFVPFVEADGYRRREWWSEDGWRWREAAGATAPVYWQRDAGAWLRRDFEQWLALEPDRPMVHVSWYEADAYCRWAGRRLPTEPEWEVVAAGVPAGEGMALNWAKRRYPWGEEAPASERANLDAQAGCCLDVAACPAGDSAWGCRQLLGNVWEWTAGGFLPYPGFVADPHRDPEQPWCRGLEVLRGGSWLTRGRLLRNTYRQAARRDRRDLWVGFRTCAVDTAS
jgi:iron(II)-dependent oxidoreductase